MDYPLSKILNIIDVDENEVKPLSADEIEAYEFIKCLKGKHIFIKGSHDNWMDKYESTHMIWEKTIEGVSKM